MYVWAKTVATEQKIPHSTFSKDLLHIYCVLGTDYADLCTKLTEVAGLAQFLLWWGGDLRLSALNLLSRPHNPYRVRAGQEGAPWMTEI